MWVARTGRGKWLYRSLRKAEKKFFGACGASTFPQNLKLQKRECENFWSGFGSGGGGGGGVGSGF